MSKKYVAIVLLTIVVIPVSGFILEHLIGNVPLSFSLFVKWFIFSAVGLRLSVAGLKQSLSPAFTAKEIFHIDSTESYPIVRELGFANICFGLTGIITLFRPEWRIVSAFASGLYYGFAGFMHVFKKPVSSNETFAMWTDLVVFSVLLVYFILFI